MSLYVAINVLDQVAGTRVCIVPAMMVQLSLAEDDARLLRFHTTLARHYCCGAGREGGCVGKKQEQ